LDRLSQTAPREQSRTDLALRAALEFCVAAAAADGPRAAAVIDPVGYHALPLEGRLPDQPALPVPPREIAERISRRTAFDLRSASVNAFTALSLEDAKLQFPAAGQWMLPPQDALIRIAPLEAAGAHWVTRPACLVVRLRGSRATVIAGTFFDACAPH
jgi:hypothetical protein